MSPVLGARRGVVRAGEGGSWLSHCLLCPSCSDDASQDQDAASGPEGALHLAEAGSWLAAAAGLAVLGLQARAGLASPCCLLLTAAPLIPANSTTQRLALLIA